MRRPFVTALTRRPAVGVAALVLALGASGALPSAGAAPPPTAASAPALSTAVAAVGRLDGRDVRLRRLLNAVVRSGGVGAVAESVDRGRVWRGAAGRAQLDPSVAAVPGAHFRAASISKMTISVLALQLVARGRWTLGTTIGEVLPGLWPGRGDVTLRQLLSHTSGLPDFDTALLSRAKTLPELYAVINRRRTDRGLVAIARHQPLLSAPGAAYSYSNTNFVVVGLMLRQATGLSLRQLLQRRVFGPARMTQSVWPTAPGLPGPRLHEYTFLFGPRVDLGGFNPTFFSAAGALVTTTRDLDRFQRALSQGRLLPRRLLRQMRAVQAVDPVGGVRYGLGSYRLPDPCSTPGSPRWLFGHDGASLGTLSLSLSSRDGTRRTTASVTGRGRSLETDLALITLVYESLAQSCPDGAPSRVRSGWAKRLLPDLALRERALSGLSSP